MEIELIPLTRGKFVLIDRADLAWSTQWKWYAQKTKEGRFYAARREGSRILLLHRELLLASRGVEVDHENGDTLDCRRSNLRPATRQQNAQNVSKTLKPTSSRFKGVCRVSARCNKTNPWIAYIGGNGIIKREYLGYFPDETSAATAYDKAAKRLFREFAALNFPL